MTSGDEPDEWLIDAARRVGHVLSRGARTPGTTAWRALLNAGIAEDEVLRLACDASGVEPADFGHVSGTMGALLPQGIALMHRVVPVGLRRETLLIATSNPRNVALERTLGRAANRRVQLQAGSPSDIIKAQAVVYGAPFAVRPGARPAAPKSPTPAKPAAGPPPRPTLAMLEPSAPVADAPVLVPTTPHAARRAMPPKQAPPAETLADQLIASAVTERASEVILDPIPDGGLLVRMRVDGALRDRFRIAEDRAAKTIASLRQSARMDSDTGKPAHGTATFRSASGPITVRVRSEGPRELADATKRAMSERLVLRLSHARGLTSIPELGFSIAEQQRVRALLAETGGLMVVAGPQGSGKTATLYAMARELSQRGRLVSTVEDAIEYPLAGVTQHQLGTVGSRSLGAALRSAASMTEDVVSSAVIADAALDAKTFDECASAASRGQLVVATLVAPDLNSAFAHLRAMHPDGVTEAAALRGVMVQRLLRRLCDACATAQVQEELPELERSLLAEIPGGNVRRPVGCDECRGAGYRGRLAIVEVVAITDALRTAITRRAIATELMQLVRAQGVPTLWESGIEQVREGTTSLAELLDAVSPPPRGAPQEDLDAMLAELLAEPRSRPGVPKKRRAD